MNHSTKRLTLLVKDLGITTDDSGAEFGHIEVYGAIFNNVDEDRDRILPGAFKRTIISAKDRAKVRNKKYLAPMLWQHDTKEVIGGWTSLEENSVGLKCTGEIILATQRGREYYALVKAGLLDQYSIIYDVPHGGAKYDKSGVRDLSELRLFSIDPVTFAANDETAVISVKSSGGDSVTICGNTKGPIGARDESWDASKAEKQIWDDAFDDDTAEVNKAKAKKYFMVVDGDGERKGDYSYPFWYVGDSPHICVGAVKAITAAIQGARGASAPEGLKAKVATLYKRINAKYPDEPELTPPWEDGEKGNNMRLQNKTRQPREQKTFQEHYTEEMCEDLLEDWQDVLICALTQAVLDAFNIGDQPEADVRDALTAFNASVMEWVENAVKYDLAGYLADNDDWRSENSIMYGNDSRPNYGYMASSRRLLRKAGRAISSANGEKLKAIADQMTQAADDHEKSMKAHLKAVRNAADDLATVLQGSEAAYGTDPGTPDDQQEGNGKNRGTPFVKTRTTYTPPSQRRDTVQEETVSAAIAEIRALRAHS